MNKLQFYTASLMGLLFGLVALAAENHALARAQAESVILQRQLARLRADTRPGERAIRSTTNDKAELERLRALVNMQAAQLETLQKQVAGLIPQPLPSTVPFSMLTFKMPRGAWSFAGYETPEEALESALWAAREGNAATLRNSLTPQSVSQRGWDTKSDAEVAAEAAQVILNATGVEVLKYETQNNGQREHLSVYLDGVDQPHQPLWVDLDKIGGAWKLNYN